MTVTFADGPDWIGFDWLGRPLREDTETTPLSADGLVVFTCGESVTVDKNTGHTVFVPAP